MAEDVSGSTTFTHGSEPFYDLFCQPCSEDKRQLEAFGFCQDCQEYLCQDCYNSHRKPRPIRHHCLLNKDEMPQTPPPSTVRSAPAVFTKTCEEHPMEMIKYYCPKHDDLVCGVCVTLSHIECGVKCILKNDIGESEEYKTLNEALLSFVKKTHETIELAKKNLTNVQQSHDDAMKDVQQIRKEMNEMMDMLEVKISAEAEVYRSADSERMNAMIRICNNFLQEAKALQTRLKTTKYQKQEFDLFLDMKKSTEDLKMLQDKIKDLQDNNHITHYVFDCSDDVWDFVNNTSAYGKLVKKCQSQPDPSATTIDHITDMSLTPSREKEGKAPILTGMVVLKGDTLVAVDSENVKNNMYVFDINKYTQKHVASLPGKPWDITRVGNESVAITFPVLKKVMCYTVSQDVSIERILPTNGSCWGIRYQRERFYVSISDTVKRIEILDKTGKRLAKIDTVDNRRIDTPGYISVSYDSLIFSEYRSGTVIKIQKNDKLEWIYSVPDLVSPLGVEVDRNGSVIVCGYESDNIHMLSPDGKRGRVILSLKGPQAVAFSKSSGRLFVTQDPFDKLRIYKMH